MPRQFADLMLGSIEIFCLTAELQSFTAAATSAGLTPAAVSRSVSRLEARLGVQLFVRTTRRVRLTDSGRSYFEQCRQALGQLVDAERAVTGEQLSPAGTVRISLPTPYGHYRVLPLVPAFRQLYPQVELEIQLSNRNVDFSSEGFDLAVRGRVPPDSGLVARKLEDAELLIVAAPKYLRRCGKPNSLEALNKHDCIQFVLPSTGQVIPWLLHKEGREVELTTQGGLRCTDDFLGPVTLARAGAGLLQTYRFIIEEDLRRGTLKEVLPTLKGASRPFSLLFPSNRHIPQRVRVLIDFLMQRLGGAPKRGRV
jgi:DNA-binding transcriptional LysR family regulator